MAFGVKKSECRKVALGNYKIPKERICIIHYRALQWTVLT